MKGTVFIALNDFIEETFGITAWEDILNTTQPASQGIYTSTENYADSEIIAIVHALCQQQGLDQGKALYTFGHYLFTVLNRKHAIFTKIQPNFLDFLASIEPVVHKEVRKLFPDAILPKLTPQEKTAKKLLLRYESQRKMCELAEGLIQGAAEFYQQRYTLRQCRCYHQGDDHCLIEITLQD